MYAKFNLSLDNNLLFFEKDYLEKGSELYHEMKQYTFANLKELIDKKIIDGDVVQNMWFPDNLFGNKKFIFISHSRKDKELAISLAGYLHEKFEIYSFIDSCVWKHSDDLNKLLNGCDYNRHGICYGCMCEEFSYNLSCVHMMLSSALSTMIDKCECVFFLNTPSSLNLNKKTESPWIYYELNIADVVQKKSEIKEPLLEYESGLAHAIEFTPKLEGMVNIDVNILRKWEQAYDPYRDDPYKVLYKICTFL